MSSSFYIFFFFVPNEYVVVFFRMPWHAYTLYGFEVAGITVTLKKFFVRESFASTHRIFEACLGSAIKT